VGAAIFAGLCLELEDLAAAGDLAGAKKLVSGYVLFAQIVIACREIFIFDAVHLAALK
jgi:hypothetical protein